jgi:hypothetical protein
MTTPLSGEISMNDLNKELGLAEPYKQLILINETKVRALLGKPTPLSTISLNDAYGKTLLVQLSATTNIQNLNIYNVMVAAGWNKSSPVEYTIPAGTYIWSDSTALPALTTGGAFPGGLKIINNGFIMGKGGIGAEPISTVGSYNNAEAGGTAINLTTPVTIDNRTGYIGGGGGGGGLLRYFYQNNCAILSVGGGGAGGGAGGKGGEGNTTFGMNFSTSAAGGAIGQAGANGVTRGVSLPAAGGGGRIMPGVGGAGGFGTIAESWTSGKGGGAGGGGSLYTKGISGSGGLGGSGGGVGGIGIVSARDPIRPASFRAGGGGGGWGANGGNGVHYDAAKVDGYTVNLSTLTATAGGAGGKAVATNTNGITWTGGFDANRVFGGVS